MGTERLNIVVQHTRRKKEYKRKKESIVVAAVVPIPILSGSNAHTQPNLVPLFHCFFWNEECHRQSQPQSVREPNGQEDSNTQRSESK